MKELLVGTAKCDITPKLGCLLYGYPSIRPSERVMDKLYLDAVAIRQDSETIIMIAADICGLSPAFSAELQAKVAKATGVKAENVTFSNTHTHSGPVTRTAAGWGTADNEYLDVTLTDAAVKAAKEAVDTLTPAVMAIGQSECYAGINRRQVINGVMDLAQDPDGPYDPTMTAIVFKTPEGKNIVTIMHFAMHPTVAGGNLSITRDWPGIMKDAVAEHTGAPCVYFNGAEGDIGPRLSNGRTIADESQVPIIGKIAADDAIKAVNAATEFDTPELKVLSGNMNLPLCDAPTLDEIKAEMEAMGAEEDQRDTAILRYAKLKKMKKMHEDGEVFPKTHAFSQTVFALGELAFVPAQFEAFCNIALNLRAQSPYKETLLLGLTGGTYAYLPTENELPRGGYEINSFRSSATFMPVFADNTDVEIVKENVKLLKALKNK